MKRGQLEIPFDVGAEKDTLIATTTIMTIVAAFEFVIRYITATHGCPAYWYIESSIVPMLNICPSIS